MSNIKILFIIPYPSGQAPSQRFRFEQYLTFLQKENITYRLESFLDIKAWEGLYKKGNLSGKAIGIAKGFFNRMKLMMKVWKYDFIFIHREAAPLGPPVFEWIIAKLLKKKIIFDFDDAIFLPNTSENNKLAAGFKWHGKVSSICKWSYKISCGNEFLANFAKKYNNSVVVNPTTIDTDHLHIPNSIKHGDGDFEPLKPAPVIGWTGSHSTMSYLKIIEPALQALQKKHTFTFRVISNHRPNLDLQNLEYVPWNKTTEIEDLSKIDIGLMPLEDDIWAKGKCGFKCLQYMALGIPSVVSPVGVNNKIIEHAVTGFFCTTDEDWVHNIEKLLENKILRKSIGEKGRKKVEQFYSVNSNKDVFLKLFT